jgi:hypothetical protein
VDKRVFETVTGSGTARCADAGGTRNAMREAQARGFRIGVPVRIGAVMGLVIGYNIAAGGPYCGSEFPLLVQTPFGTAKCSLAEITPV